MKIAVNNHLTNYQHPIKILPMFAIRFDSRRRSQSQVLACVA
jgi:hypothetical protein